MNRGSKALFLPCSNSKHLRKNTNLVNPMEHKIIDTEYSQLSLQQKVVHTKKFVNPLLIIQLCTYRVSEMTITIGILIGSSSIDDKWKDANLSYYNFYKIFQ